MGVAPRSAVKNNLVAAWREFFVVEDGMLEVLILPVNLAASAVPSSSHSLTNPRAESHRHVSSVCTLIHM